MMKWHCKHCETINTDSDKCVVCGEQCSAEKEKEEEVFDDDILALVDDNFFDSHNTRGFAVSEDDFSLAPLISLASWDAPVSNPFLNDTHKRSDAYNSLWGLEQHPNSYILLWTLAILCTIIGIFFGNMIGFGCIFSGIMCGLICGFFVAFCVKLPHGIEDRIVGGVICGVLGSILGGIGGFVFSYML